MTSHALLSQVFKKDIRLIADELGLSQQRLYQWAEPPPPQGSGALNPLDRIAGILLTTRDRRVAEWVCQKADGFYIPNPDTLPANADELAQNSTVLIGQFADMITLLAETAKDGKITAEESKQIRGAWDKIKSVSESYVRLCENGYFREKRNIEEKPTSRKKVVKKKT